MQWLVVLSHSAVARTHQLPRSHCIPSDRSARYVLPTRPCCYVMQPQHRVVSDSIAFFIAFVLAITAADETVA